MLADLTLLWVQVIIRKLSLVQMGFKKKSKGKPKQRKRSVEGGQLLTTESGDEQTPHNEAPRHRVSFGKDAQKDDFSHVSIFNQPLLSATTLARVVVGALKSVKAFAEAHWVPLVVAVLAILSFSLAPLPQALEEVSSSERCSLGVSFNQQRASVSDFILFALYWIGLGIASSVGLGTGLHTFILYLGPHIAQVVMAANMCNQVPEMIPSRWRFDHFAPCQSVPPDQINIGFLPIYKAVFLEAFLWGAGTALGELPPYFVARAASAAGGIDEELQDLELFNETGELPAAYSNESWIVRSKMKLAVFLKNYAFITVLAMASVSETLLAVDGWTLSLRRLFVDPESVVRLGRPDVRPLPDPLHVVLPAYPDRQSNQQSVDPGHLHRRRLF